MQQNNSSGSVRSARQLYPSSVEEAAALLSEGFIPVGGGTDLMVRNHALKKAGNQNGLKLFSCRNISSTGLLNISNGLMTIGSSVTLADIISFAGCPELLRRALLSIASPGIRNTATLTGNICNASPAADSLPVLYILDAEIKVESAAGAKTVPIKDFIQGPGSTTLGRGEIVTSISFRLPDTGGSFRKIGTRAANALSKLSIASIVKKDDGVFTDFRLAVGACAPRVIRSPDAESLLIGNTSEKAAGFRDAIISGYDELLSPINDQRSTADYRKNTALRLIENIIFGV